ncbi:unnamed protein product [Pleuronectes platessa]|uniref:Uncharacterized protein n=1 Tax=Pleuronectes platessa TaxID=8262 RepID=A0A9N7ZC79_PLEPL|nr:unnamed protein product [Pleuronectes platessa]
MAWHHRCPCCPATAVSPCALPSVATQWRGEEVLDLVKVMASAHVPPPLEAERRRRERQSEGSAPIGAAD